MSLREEKGWSQRELARRVNLNPSVMNRIELSERPIKDQELAKIADVLDVTTDYLLGRTDDPQGYINISYDGGGLDIKDEEEEEFLKVQLAEFRKMRERMKKRLQEQQKKEQ